jgi:hypothetical protein
LPEVVVPGAGVAALAWPKIDPMMFPKILIDLLLIRDSGSHHVAMACEAMMTVESILQL